MAETVTFSDVTVIRESDKGEKNIGSILCLIEGEESWIPKKVIHDDSEVYNEDTSGDLVLPLWYAERVGLA